MTIWVIWHLHSGKVVTTSWVHIKCVLSVECRSVRAREKWRLLSGKVNQPTGDTKHRSQEEAAGRVRGAQALFCA